MVFEENIEEYISDWMDVFCKGLYEVETDFKFNEEEKEDNSVELMLTFEEDSVLEENEVGRLMLELVFMEGKILVKSKLEEFILFTTEKVVGIVKATELLVDINSDLIVILLAIETSDVATLLVGCVSVITKEEAG